MLYALSVVSLCTNSQEARKWFEPEDQICLCPERSKNKAFKAMWSSAEKAAKEAAKAAKEAAKQKKKAAKEMPRGAVSALVCAQSGSR